MSQSQKKLNVDATEYLNEYSAKVSINNVEFLPQNIEVCNIKESIFNIIPTLELVFKDDGLFIEKFPLQEGSEIKIEIAKNSEKESPLNLIFTLENYNVVNLDGDYLKLALISLTGLLKITNFLNPIQTRAFKNKSSIDVLKLIATEGKLNPISKITTSDNMTWLQINQCNYGMINTVLERSYKSNDGVLCAITRNNDFIITSIGTETKKTNIKDVQFDPEKAISNHDVNKDNKKNIIYFNNYEIVDIAGIANKTGGYGINYGTYDFSERKNILFNPNLNKLSEFNNKRTENINKPSEYFDCNILNELNMHKNYYNAIIQNYYFKRDFFKFGLVLHINPTKYINLFDTINVTFPALDFAQNVNESLSGKFIVGAIFHQVSRAGFYRMILSCYRQGFNKSGFVDKYDVVGLK